MNYKELDFGKHAGCTLPSVIFKDADWFYWACQERKFDRDPQLKAEADDLYAKSRAIKIPPEDGIEMRVEYLIGLDGSCWETKFLPRSEPIHSTGTKRICMDYIDLEIPRQHRNYDKGGYRRTMRTVKPVLFKGRKRVSAGLLEEFFSNPDNFNSK